MVGASTAWTRVLNTCLLGLAVLLGLSGLTGATRLRAVAVTVITGSIALAATLESSLRVVTNLLDTAFLVLLAFVLVARFRTDLVINAQSILAAVSVYLVIGMLYANLDLIVSHLTAQPFFSGPAVVAGESKFVYFSFITLATVGYGDLTPGTGLARALAVSEALTGQLYLVTVIALVVSNLGRSRARPNAGDQANR
jgi:hypothetical protein